MFYHLTRAKKLIAIGLVISFYKFSNAIFMDRDVILSNLHKVNWDLVKQKVNNPPQWWIDLFEQAVQPYRSRKPSQLVLDSKTLQRLPRQQDDFFWRITISNGTLKTTWLDEIRGHWVWLKGPRQQIYEKVIHALIEERVITTDADFVFHFQDLIYEAKANIPVFARFKHKDSKGIILIPDQQILALLFERQDILLKALDNPANAWNTKKEVLFWRGAGYDWIKRGDWEPHPNIATHTPRLKLVRMSNSYDYIDAALVLGYKPKKYINMLKSLSESKGTQPEEQFAYKYHVSLDGSTTAPSGLLWKLLSNSITIKQDSNNVEWFYHLLQPYVHYIPVTKDLSNLHEVYAWLKNNDKQAQAIADASTDFILNNVMLEDVLAYFAFVINEYGKLQALEK